LAQWHNLNDILWTKSWQHGYRSPKRLHDRH
jgi:hypothetical protein